MALGGAEVLLANTVNSLPDYTHTLITLVPNSNLKYNLNNTHVGCINFSSKSRLLSSALKLRKQIIGRKINIVHSHLFWSTVIARIACIGLNVKFVFSLHTIMSKDSFNYSKPMLWLEKLTYTKKQTVVGVSNAVLNDYNNVVGIRGESHVLYNFIDDSFFLPQLINKKEENQVLKLVAVGNIKSVKNYPFLIEVFKCIDNSKFLLDIYGEGEQMKELQIEIAKHDLNIKFKGAFSKLESVLPYYDAFVMTSLFEGFGIAALEAMAVGLPVLLSDIDVFREIANDEAVFFKLDDKQELVSILNTFSQNKSRLQELALKGKKRARIIAKKEVYLKKLNSIYLS